MNDLQQGFTQRMRLLDAWKENPDRAAELRRIARETGVPQGLVNDDVITGHRLAGAEQQLSGLKALPAAIRKSQTFATLAQDDMPTLSSIEQLSQARKRLEEAQAAEDAKWQRDNAPTWLGETRDAIFSGFRKFANDRDLQAAIDAQITLDGHGYAQDARREAQLHKLEAQIAEAGGLENLGIHDQNRYLDLIDERQAREAELKAKRDKGIADYLEDAYAIEHGNTMTDALREQYQGFAERQGLSKAWHVATNPRLASHIFAESLGRYAPVAAAGSAVGMVSGGAGLATFAAGSFASEYSASLEEQVKKLVADSGGQITAEQLVAALEGNDMRTLADKAGLRAAPIALMDAISMGAAGWLARWGQMAARPVAATAASMGVGGATGATGEALGQTFSEGKVDWGDVAIEGMFEMPFGAIEIAAAYGKNRLTQAKTEQQAELANLADISKAVQDSKLRERAPEIFADLAHDIAANADHPHLYLDANALHQSGLMDVIADAVPDLAAPMQEAAEAGGAVQIPLADYLAKIAPDAGLVASLSEHVRFEPEGLSLAEITHHAAAELEADIEARAQEMAEAQALDAEVQTVKQNILDQLNAVGRFTPEVNEKQATLAAATYETWAARLHTTPQELFARHPLRIAGESAEGGFNQPLPDMGAMIATAKEKIRNLIQSIREKPSKKQRFADYLDVDAQAAQEASAHGLDIAGFKHVLDESAVQHVTNRHGDPIVESTRGQIAITDSDFETIADVVSAPEKRIYGLKTKDGQDIIASVKALEDGTMAIVEEVRVGRRKLAVKTLRKHTAATDFDTIVDTLLSNARSDGGRTHIQVVDVADNHNTLYQNPAPPRGKFIPDSNTIILLENADLSTFQHELGHFYLESMVGFVNDLRHIDTLSGGGTLSETEKQMLRDVDILMDWFGLDLETWNRMTLAEKRPYHEQQARGFERFIMEGKAPSLELEGVFARMLTWFLHLYKKLTALDVELSDEVRQVYGRMLASDEAIALAEQNRSMRQMFVSAEEAGMTVEAFAAYQQEGEGARSAALDEMRARVIRDAKYFGNAKNRALAAKQKEAREIRAELTMEARAMVMRQPVYRAWSILTGKGTDEQPALRLNPAALVDMGYTAEQIQSLGRKVRKKDSVHPDLIAEVLPDAEGNPVYDSGDALVQDLLAARPPQEAIRELTDKMMLERFGELSSPEAIAEAADMAAHNDIRLRAIATDAAILAKAVGGQKVLASAAKAVAQQTIANKKLKDIRPHQFTRMETRAAKAAEQARKKGDIATAAAEKRNQVLQASLARAAWEAQEEAAKIVRYLKRMEKLNPKVVAIEYREQIEGILERYNLRTQSGKALTRTQSLAEWVERQREQGIEPDLSAHVRDEMQRTSWQNLTITELRGLADSIAQIEHLGRLKNKLLANRKQQDYDAVISNMVGSIVANATKSGIENRTPTTRGDKMKASVRRFLASHRKVAMIARMMDGEADGGPVTENLITTANRAADFETEWRGQASEKLTEILAPLIGRKDLNKKQSFVIAGKVRSFTHQDIFGMALNWGNDGNRQRLLDGEGWTEDDIKPLLARLTKAEWLAVQQVWNYISSFKDDIAAKERRVYGKEPDWVEAAPFTQTTADGETITLDGGYYPIKYDTRASETAAQQEEAELAKRQMYGAHTAATTKRSFTKTRVAEVHDRPLRYDLAGVYQGLNDVIHDLAWHEWLIDTNKLLRSKRLTDAIRDHYGADTLEQIKNWVRDIAEGDMQADRKNIEALHTIRKYASVAGLGFNVLSALKQPLGLMQSVARVGGAEVLASLGQFVAHPVRMTKEARQESSFMRNRAKTRFRELNEVRNALEQKNAVKQVISNYSYIIIMAVQQCVDVITWHAQRNKSLAAGASFADANAHADQAVIDSQGSGMVKDLSAIERGNISRLFTVYYGFMNTVYNLEANAIAAKKNSMGQKAATILMLAVVMPILDAALSDLLKPGDSGEWDEDDWAKSAGKAVANSLTGHFFALREIQFSGYGYQGPVGLRSIADAHKLIEQAGQGEFDRGFRKALINTAGSWMGLPAAQINRTWDGAEALADDKTDNPSVLLFGHQPR